MRSKRLQKKLHKKWLELGIVDATMHSYWRKLLFTSETGTRFKIDSVHCTGLSKDIVNALNTYDLKYCVAKVPAPDAPAWLSESGLVVFRFWAAEFPGVYMLTGNNSEVW